MKRVIAEIGLHLLVAIALVVMVPPANAQDRSIQWTSPAFPFNERSTESLNSLRKDNEGNIVGLWYTADGIHGSQLALTKLRPDGTVVWDNRNPLDETSWYPHDVKVNDDGEIFALIRVGYNEDTRAMLLAFSPDGNLAWKKLLERGMFPSGSVHVDSIGIVIAFYDGYGSEGSRVSRYSSEGDLLWEQDPEIERLGGYKVDKFLNVNVVGSRRIDDRDHRLIATSISPEGAVEWSYTEDYTGSSSITSTGDDSGRVWFSIADEIIALDSDGQQMWRYSAADLHFVTEMMSTDSGELIVRQNGYPLTRVDTDGYAVADYDDFGCSNNGFQGGYVVRSCDDELGVYNLDLNLIAKVPGSGNPRPGGGLAVLGKESGGVVLGQSFETEANDTDVRVLSFDANGTEEWRVLFPGEETGGINDSYRIGAAGPFGNSIFVATEYVGSRRDHRLAKINSFGAVDYVAEAPLFRTLYPHTDLHVDAEGFTIAGNVEDRDSTGYINHWIIARFDENAREEWRYITDEGWIPALLGPPGSPTHAVISRTSKRTSSLIRLDGSGGVLWEAELPFQPYSYGLQPDGYVYLSGPDLAENQFIFIVDGAGNSEKINVDPAITEFQPDDVIRSTKGGYYLLGPYRDDDFRPLYHISNTGALLWTRVVSAGTLAQGANNSVVTFSLVDQTNYEVTRYDDSGELAWTRTFDSDGARLFNMTTVRNTHTLMGKTGLTTVWPDGTIDQSIRYDKSSFPRGSSATPQFHSVMPTGETVIGFSVSGVGYSYGAVQKYGGYPTTLTASSARIESSYPNPFSQSTSIVYDVRETANVRLFVYDVVGRRVATLVDGIMPAGKHSAVFSADDRRASGVYIAVLSVGNLQASKAITLVR